MSAQKNLGSNDQRQINQEQVYQWIKQICNPKTCENALRELSKNRYYIDNLAPMLWNSFGTTSALLQEITKIYPAISPPTLNEQQSRRICYTLCLFQFIASHPETRAAFLKAEIPMYILPFLSTTCATRPFDHLRLTSLGVISSLVEPDNEESIKYLLNTDIVTLCLGIMEDGFELIQVVATYIMEKLLLHKSGLSFVCDNLERFTKITSVLGKMVIHLETKPCARLLKRIVRCYLKLSDYPQVRGALYQVLPDQLRDNTSLSAQCDKTTKEWIQMIMKNISLDGEGVSFGTIVGAPVAADGGGTVVTADVNVVPQQQQ